MSAGPQISWDEQPKAPPQSVQWDENPAAQPGAYQTEKGGPINNATGKTDFELNVETPKNKGFWAGVKSTIPSWQSMARRAALGGFDPVSEIGAIKSFAQTPENIEAGAASAREVTPQLEGHPWLNKANRAISSLVGGTAGALAPAVGVNPQGQRERALAGDTSGIAGENVVPMAGALTPMAHEALVATKPARAALVKPVTDIATNAINRLRTPPAQEALTQAIQPGVRIPKAQESIAIAGPRIQQIRQAQGVEIPAKGPEALKAVLDLNKEAKAQILSAIEDRLGPVADLRPNTKGVADAIRSSIDDITLEEGGNRNAVENAAKRYEREGTDAWTLRQLENRMHTLNNRLGRFYSQPTGGEGSVPVQAELDLAEAGAVRKLIDSSVEKLSGSGVKDLKREYGAQRDVEKSLARQYAVATRVKGAPLWEGLAYLQAAGDLVTGGVWGAAKAAGRIVVGNRLQTLRDPGYLANQAFHGSKAFEAAPPIPAHAGPPPPKGALPAPATPMGGGGPDISGSFRGGRWTTPKAQLPGEKPIEAEFIPRRVSTEAVRTARAGINRMLPESTTPKTNIPPSVSPEFARDVIAPNNETRLGRTGEGGIRIPTKGLLPAAREAASIPEPPTPAPQVKPPVAPKRGGKPTPTPAKPTAQLEKLEAGKTPAYVAAAAKEAGAMTGGYQPGEHPGMGFFQFHDPELGGSFYIREGQVSGKAIKDAMEARRKTIEPSPLVEEKTQNVKNEMARREGRSENELLEQQAEESKAKIEKMPPVQQTMTDQELAEAEGTIRQEVGMMQSMDRPGRYFDRSSEEEHTLAGRRGKNERMGGAWRTVKSGRNMMPFMREHPEVSPSKAAEALEKDGTNPTYQRLMRAALEFVRRQKGQ